jgi:hypothetical protein
MAQGIYFRSDAHKTRLLNAIQSIGKVYDNGKLDPEYACALYILTNEEGTWEQTRPYVSRDGIDFEPGILTEQDFGGAYTSLIELAGNLFSGGSIKANPADFTARLDEYNFAIAVSAIMIRRHGLHINDLKGE